MKKAIKERKKTTKIIYSFFKRLFDIIIGILGIILLIPVSLIVKLINILNKDFAPIFYSHIRIGKNGKEFRLYKFRSMVPNADKILKELLKEKKYAEEWKKNQKFENDPRITKAGKFLRKSSLDELPQFINVFKGDMSLIGPRPLLVKYIPYYSEREQLRHTVRPGITGWAQVHGRNHVLWEERFELDAYYVEHLSLWMDIRIILTTIKNVLQRKDIEVAPNLMDFDEYRRQQAAGRVFLKVEDAVIK